MPLTRAAGALAVTIVSAALLAGAGPAAVGRESDASSDALIHADAARAAGFTGVGVTVAVLDTGIDERNPDLADAVVAEHCVVPPDGCPNETGAQDGPGSAQDDQGHGTEIAGLITGNGTTAPVGVAPDARLVAVKVTDRNGRTSTAQIVAGLQWVLDHRPDVRVVNVSLAGDILLSGSCDTLTPALAQYGSVIRALRARGTLVFAPSGNAGSRFSMSAPACLHSTVAVGAVYSQDFGPYTVPFVCRDATTAPDEVACFSNTSTELDLLAPGAPVESTALGGGRSTFAGTSAASAEAAGAAAMLLQARPSLTPDEVVAALEDTGMPVTDPRSHAELPRLDVAAALSVVLGRPVPLLPSPAAAPPAGPPVLSAPALPAVSLPLRPIDFGKVALGRTARRALALRNAGTGYLTVRVARPAAPLGALPAKLLLRPGGRGTIALAYRPTRRGAYRGVLRLRTDDPRAAVIAIAVRGSGY